MSDKEFKAGDKVKCIDNKLMRKWFDLGGTYIISKVCRDGEHVCFDHTNFAMWHSDRFELIEKDKDMEESNNVTNVKTVNGIKLTAGQQWQTRYGNKVTLQENPGDDTYVFRAVNEKNEWCSITKDGKLWKTDNESILQHLISSPLWPVQFNPKPGDKIICNNGEEFTCCTLGFLLSKDLPTPSLYELLAYRDNPNNEYTGIDWIGWNSRGKSSNHAFNIREVIPEQKEETVPEEIQVKLELTYTVEDIRKAVIDDLGWQDLSLDLIMKSLEKVTSKEYNEYLRLKAMFESDEE